MEFFLEKYASLKNYRLQIDQDVLNVFHDYPWPGNIRELENIMERLILISSGDTIRLRDLPREFQHVTSTDTPIKPIREAIQEFKIRLVQDALSQAGGKKSQAAALLGMPRSNFSRLLNQLGLR